MNAYMISTTDQPGLASRLFEAAQRRGVNIFPAYGLADGTVSLVLVGSNDEAGLAAAIADAGLTATKLEMVVTQLENKPGTGAALFGKLSAAGVSLRAAVPVDMDGDRVTVALAAGGCIGIEGSAWGITHRELRRNGACDSAGAPPGLEVEALANRRDAERCGALAEG